MAACTLAVAVAHLLLAQLTLAFAVTFALTGRATRWQPWWLLGPAVAGLLWTLAAGPGAAIAGFARGPARVLGYFGDGHLAGGLGHPLGAFAGIGSWLPGQAPLALIIAAIEAAVVCWLDWLRTDEWAVKQARLGPAAALRRIFTARMIRAGGVLTREGCALGIAPATGGPAELRWDELADGALVAGADPAEVAVTCLQVVHAALRRRKPLIVLDGSGDASVSAALAAACRATATPLWLERAGVRLPGQGSASQLWGRGQRGTDQRGADQPDEPGSLLGPVIRERRAVLLAADSPQHVVRARDELAVAGARLRRIGIAGDALVWVPDGARLPAEALAAMIRDGSAVGLPVLVGTTSPTAAAAIAGLVGTVLVHRVASPELAASLAARTGTWLLPASALDGSAGGIRPAGGFGPPDGRAAAAPATSPPGLVSCPRVKPRTLLTLGPGRFVLAVNGPRPRLVTGGQIVPAQLPPVGQREGTRP